MDGRQRRALRDLLAKQAIADNLARHSRGVDRADLRLLQGAYHRDATVAYGLFEGAAKDFTEFLVDLQNGLPSALHRTSNMLVQVDDADDAVSESYVIAYLESPDTTGAMQRLIGGRYLDRHRRVGDAWRLQHRTYVLDWNINQATREVISAFAGQRGAKRNDDVGQARIEHWITDTTTPDETPRMPNPSNDAGLARDLDLALSRQTLQELVTAYCRGVDRADADVLRAVFHPDARVIAVITIGPEDSPSDMLVGGRYVDRFERRDGVWKIAERMFVQDWNMIQPTSAQFNDEFYGSLKLRGGFAPNDPIYAFWK